MNFNSLLGLTLIVYGSVKVALLIFQGGRQNGGDADGRNKQLTVQGTTHHEDQNHLFSLRFWLSLNPSFKF
jgi:hypothetical protein